MRAPRVVRSYYRAIDERRYDDLRDLLAPVFVHERPDRTLDGPDTFVEFMREERPLTDTSHAIDAVYADGNREFAVRGRLLGADDDPLFGFVDVHIVDDGAITHIHTYADRSS